MRVLMVMHAAPCSPALGPARRHLHLLEEISRRHRVSIITVGSPGERERFEHEHHERCDRAVFVARRPRLLELAFALWYFATGRCVFRRLYRREVQRVLDRAITSGRFDAIYFSTVLLGYYRVPEGIRTIGDAHNVEHEVLARAAIVARNPLERAYYRQQARVTERDERRLARKFTQIWATSDRDAERFADARGDSGVAVVPNGIRLTARQRDDRAPQSGPVLLFVGLMSYLPNADAALFFLDDVFPLISRRLTTATVLIVGANPPRRLKARASASVRIVGRVASVDPYFEIATAFVAPLRSGGGTRVKILEAMMHGVPVVTTAMGCEGLAVRDRQSALVADSPQAFADAVVSVCTNPLLARGLANGARELVRSNYDWRHIGESIHTLLDGRAYA
jgi:glycosyltransferase involved in cell wall biosynthesis